VDNFLHCLIKIMLAVLKLHPCPYNRRRAPLAHRHFIEAAADTVPDSGWRDCGYAEFMDIEEQKIRVLDAPNFI
jgi:hypothetical protein